MILFLKVALHDTWLCHPHAPSVMLHTVTCSIVSQSVPPSQILREQWCRRCSVHPDSVPFWVRHPWLFNPTSSFNTFRTVLAHVTFIGQACER